MNIHSKLFWLFITLSLLGCSANHGEATCTVKDIKSETVVSAYDDIYGLNQAFSVRNEQKTYFAEKNIYSSGEVKARYIIYHIQESDLLFVICLYSRHGKSGLVFAVHSLDENGLIYGPDIYDDLAINNNQNSDLEVAVASSELDEEIVRLKKMLNRDLPGCVDGVFTVALVRSGKKHALVNGWDAEIYAHSMEDIEQAYERMFKNDLDSVDKTGSAIDKRSLRIYDAICNMGSIFDGDILERKTLPEWIEATLESADRRPVVDGP